MAAANVDHADRAGRHRGHGRPRRSGVKVDPGRHRGQATRYKKEKRRKKEKKHFHHHNFFLEREILGGGEVGWRGAPVTAGDWRLRAVATPALGIPSLARGGKLSQTSDRLYSCGFPDRQSRPSSATGAGGFEVLIANCKIARSKIILSRCKSLSPINSI